MLAAAAVFKVAADRPGSVRARGETTRMRSG